MPAPSQIDWYDTPLYYDIIFDEDTVEEANFLEAMQARHGTGAGNQRSVLELACGSGRLLRELGTRGWRTAGFDANPHMLAFARDRLARENIAARLWEDRMESFTVPGGKKFNLVHCLVSTFKYLLTEADALASLSRVADVLKPGGLFILGLHLTDYRDSKVSHERWVVTRDGIEVVCNTRTWPVDPGTRTEAMRSRLRVTLPDGSVGRQETHWTVRSYSAAQLRRLLGKVTSLQLVACHDFRHDPDEHRKLDDSYADIVLVLKKS
jgi:SAM-dependent methyltransferase